MIFLSVVMQVVYWVMDHNNPNKQQANGIKQILSPPHTGDESVVELTREQIRLQSMSFSPPPPLLPAPQEDSKSPAQYNVMTDTDRPVTVKPYSITDQYHFKGCNSDDCERRHRWDKYQMDYMGRDSFDNILVRLNHSLASDVSHPH
ncbi:uncharacterized protein LOC110459839 isoform X1 [Mizuhopecten yessoensis]|uniref:Uncharacterized protein n=1 Tax=Mizuhopecten yessoensis TaxID=6573 RepID=A0A210Q3P1_MIZYE|nr:uncharacterized protein LOC110459839 isoform X1 [Mizuhopecten yessoensis]OWF43361.1 hypothetical protein KP79_PYT10071 [Mizuhopecten yessoensis]